MFCTKCGTQLNENGQCPKCAPFESPVVAAPALTTSQVKAAWFVPVVLLINTIGGGIISGIFNLVYELFNNIFGGYNSWLVSLTGALATIITAALTLGAIWFLFSMAFKTVDEKEKKSYMLLMLVPFALIWVKGIITSVLYNLVYMFDIYNSFFTGAIGFLVSVAVIVLSYFLTQKAITFVEKNK